MANHATQTEEPIQQQVALPPLNLLDLPDEAQFERTYELTPQEKEMVADAHQAKMCRDCVVARALSKRKLAVREQNLVCRLK